MGTTIRVKQPQFSAWVRQQRTHLKKSQSELICELDGRISKNTILKIEGGHENKFREHTLMELAKVLNVDFEELLAATRAHPGSIEGAQNSEMLKPANTNGRHHHSPTSPKSRLPVTRIGLMIAVVIGTTLPIFSLNKLKFSYPAKMSHAVLTPDSKGVVFKNDLDETIRVAYGNEKLLSPVIFNKDDGVRIVVAVGDGGNDPQRDGRFVCYDQHGDTVWTFDANDAVLRHGMGEKTTYPRSGYLRTTLAGKGRFFGNAGEFYFWYVAKDPEYAPTRIGILDPISGRSVYTFWNPGTVHDVQLIDLNRDGIDEMLVSALNNRFADRLAEKTGQSHKFYLATVLLLEPQIGETYRAPYMRIGDYGTGTIRWLAFPHPYTDPAHIEIDWHTGEPRAKIANGLFGFFHYLDYDGNACEPQNNKDWINRFGSKTPPPLLVMKLGDQACSMSFSHTLTEKRHATLQGLYSKQGLKVYTAIQRSCDDEL